MSLFPHNLPETHSSGFPIISSKFRHKGVVKGVGGAWIGVEPIGGHTKGGAYVGWVGGMCLASESPHHWGARSYITSGGG